MLTSSSMLFACSWKKTEFGLKQALLLPEWQARVSHIEPTAMFNVCIEFHMIKTLVKCFQLNCKDVRNGCVNIGV